MAQELKELIEKIQEEGVKAGSDKAREIEERAKADAAAILARAKKEADKIIAEAGDKAARTEESSHATLKQAGRDLILSLRKEIDAMLDRLVASHVHKALGAEELAKMLLALVKDAPKPEAGQIVITLKKEDLEKLEKGFLSELRGEVKKGVILRSSDDIDGGFLISYDSGKSYYDFTDKALARYIAYSLKPKLADILNGIE